MVQDLAGKYTHRDVGTTMVLGGRGGTYTISFVNRRGEVCMIYRSDEWVRRAIKHGDLVRCTEATCPTS